MAAETTPRWTIIGRVALLGASLGIVLGLVEAGSLRLPDFRLALLMPHVPPSFWFFAPLLTSVAFGLVGVLAGFTAALPKSRFLGMVMIAGLAGLAGGYFWLLVQYYPSGLVWVIFLQEIITPSLVCALVFACTLAPLWATRRPGSSLGALADIPIRLWSWLVFGLMATLAAAVGISNFPNHLMASTTHAQGRSQSPNIVLIVMDTVRADHLSSYGYFRNTTPNIDQLTQHGALFENAIAASNWTLPAMSSMFTSLLPHQHGASADTAFGPGPRTVAELVALADYETAGFNANSTYGIVPWGLARGFETYVDSTTTLGYSLDASRIGSNFIEPYAQKWTHLSRLNEFTAGQLNEQVYRWFDHRSDRPFFLYVHYDDAHDPYEVPPPYDSFYGRVPAKTKLRLEEAKFGRAELSAGERESIIAGYDNALKYIDSQVGELLRFLERSSEWSNTYIIITADHGEAFGEHGAYTHGWDLHREVLHVPLVVVGPGIPAGVRISHTARTRQIFSTVLEFAGAKHDVLLRSSLSRMWKANYVPTTPDEATLSEVIDNPPPPMPVGVMSITTREWHFIWERDERPDKLYHWTTDPLEQQDVSNLPDNQATIETLKAKIFSLVERSYRPWRDTRYLEALTGPDFSPDDEARKPAHSIPGGPLITLGPGAPQTVFTPNSENNRQNPDEELLRSLPYEGAH